MVDHCKPHWTPYFHAIIFEYSLRSLRTWAEIEDRVSDVIDAVPVRPTLACFQIDFVKKKHFINKKFKVLKKTLNDLPVWLPSILGQILPTLVSLSQWKRVESLHWRTKIKVLFAIWEASFWRLIFQLASGHFNCDMGSLSLSLKLDTKSFWAHPILLQSFFGG